jgi:DNA-binding transcriptional ArsR family regulator
LITGSRISSDLLLHPLRLRIIQMLYNGKQLTARQMADEQPDIPQATLYRHLHQLVQGGLLVVAEERQVRNMTEKVYALATPDVFLDPADTVQMSKEHLLHLFTAFAALLMSDFQRYLQGHSDASIDFRREVVTFWQRSVALTDAEAQQLLDAIDAQLATFTECPPDPARRQRLVSVVLLPDGDSSRPETGED